MAKFSYSSDIVRTTMTSSHYTTPVGVAYSTSNTGAIKFSSLKSDVASDSGSGKKVVTSVFRIFFAILFASVVFQTLVRSGKTITFTGFLDWLHNFTPAIKNTHLVFSPIVSGDWGIFDFLRNTINLFNSVIQFVIWIIENLVNLVSYITGFFGFLFG